MEMKKVRKAGWEKKASPEEKRLVDRVYELADLFRDMLFQPGTSTDLLLNQPFLDPETGEWQNDKLSLPPILERFSYNYFRFKVAHPRGKNGEGYYDFGKQELCIGPEDLDSDPVILHELIHLHEHVIWNQDVPHFLHDILYWALYQQARKRIPRLDDIVSNQAILLALKQLGRHDMDHGILFLLKSFDLDMRKGYPLGTVYGYGRDDDFKDFPYIPYSGK